MRVLSEGRGAERHPVWLLLFLVGVAWLAVVGAFVVVHAIIWWLA